MNHTQLHKLKLYAFITSSLLLSGCYSSIPPYGQNDSYHINDDNSAWGFAPIMSINLVGFQKADSIRFKNENDNHNVSSIENNLFRSIARKSKRVINYANCLANSQNDRIYNYDAAQLMYFFEGVHYGLTVDSLHDANEARIPKGAIVETDSFIAERINPEYFHQYKCPESIMIFISTPTIKKESDTLFIYDAGYIVWDYGRNTYLTKGRLGPVRHDNTASVIKMWRDYFMIANQDFLRR